MNYSIMPSVEPFIIIREPTNHFVDIYDIKVKTTYLIRSIINKNDFTSQIKDKPRILSYPLFSSSRCYYFLMTTTEYRLFSLTYHDSCNFVNNLKFKSKQSNPILPYIYQFDNIFFGIFIHNIKLSEVQQNNKLDENTCLVLIELGFIQSDKLNCKFFY